MDPKDYDRVAGKIPTYGKLLLSVPAWVKAQTFDIHIKAEQPIALCGRDGVYFLDEGGQPTRQAERGKAVPLREMRELFLQICGHSVFHHEEEIRQGYVSLGGVLRVGLCGTAVLEKTACRACGRSPPWCSAFPGKCGDVRTGCFRNESPGRKGFWWQAHPPAARPRFCGMWHALCPPAGLDGPGGLPFWMSGESWACSIWVPAPMCCEDTLKVWGLNGPCAPFPRNFSCVTSCPPGIFRP